jgi:cation efflux family protein
LALARKLATMVHGEHDHAHGHTHGVVDPSIATTTRGIWAIKWSFVILAATALMQLMVVYFSGSVALLADTIHNIADAGTAIPLWIALEEADADLHLRLWPGRGLCRPCHRPDHSVQRVGSGIRGD